MDDDEDNEMSWLNMICLIVVLIAAVMIYAGLKGRDFLSSVKPTYLENELEK